MAITIQFPTAAPADRKASRPSPFYRRDQPPKTLNPPPQLPPTDQKTFRSYQKVVPTTRRPSLLNGDPRPPQAPSQPPASRAGIIPGLIRLPGRLAGPDNDRFASELNALYIANGLDPIIAPGISLTASAPTSETTTRTTTLSISTQTPEPPMTRAAQR
ncbi:mucin-7-like [Procambarus clarkii]|uniref:mucin-7-like n=1 Tax=Procambarus clarkii TaxID=6728 RepID=UPI0037449AB2